MSNFSIHLSEPLSDNEAKRVAQLTAPALGGSPEKLQLLLSRQAGSRIARASNQRQAETVANILRSAGVKVDVLENAPEGEVTPPSAVVPPAIAAPPARPVPSNDPFAAPAIPPLNAQVVDSFAVSKPDSFLASADPFGASKPIPNSDPFAAPKSDPFAAPKSEPFANPIDSKPLSAPKSDSFAAPKSDPFAAPKSDPFAAPKSDPFAAPKSDPFAAPRSDSSPRTSIGIDPFAAPGTAVVLDQKEVALTDLPSQARKARDRVMPRTSVRNQMLVSLIIPYVLVAMGTIGFMAYQLPIIYRQELGLRAYQATLSEAKSSFDLVEQLPTPTAREALQLRVSSNLTQIPEAVALIYQADILEISSNSNLAAFASTLNMTKDEANDLETQFNRIEGQGLRFDTITFRGQPYVGSYAKIKNETISTPGSQANPVGTGVGDVHVMFSLAQIPTRIAQAIIPLLIGLAIIFIFTLFLANALATRLARPIISATDQANRIALGDLDRSVTVESNDEIGDMLGSLERMRVSLKSMVARMRRNT
jgi:HAMP domain-containing protein